MTSQPLLQNVSILERPEVANFAGIIKIAIMLIQKTFKHQIKSLKKSITIQFLSVFPDITQIVNFW